MFSNDGKTMTYVVDGTVFEWTGGMYIEVGWYCQPFFGDKTFIPEDIINLVEQDESVRIQPGDSAGFIMECESYLSEDC